MLSYLNDLSLCIHNFSLLACLSNEVYGQLSLLPCLPIGGLSFEMFLYGLFDLFGKAVVVDSSRRSPVTHIYCLKQTLQRMR